MAGSILAERVRPALLVGLAAAVALSAASVVYEVSLGAHGGVAGGGRILAFVADGAGVLVAAIVLTQLLAGYRLFGASAKSQRALHVALAWTTAAVLLVHGGTAIVHALTPPTEPATLVLVVMGLAAAGPGVYQFATGAHAARQVRTHYRVAQVVSILVLAHVFVGVWHAVTG